MFGRNLDLNETILWLSLYSDTTIWSEFSDKFAVRKYIKEKVLESILVDISGKWENVYDIDWVNLPESFLLYSNNGSGIVLIVKDKFLLNI